MNHGPRGISRRGLLRGALGAGATLSLRAGTLASLAHIGAAQASTEYRALVCILLAGGADSFNMLVPSDAAGYAEYQTVRSDLALEQASLTPLAGTHQGGRTFGMNPAMAALGPLFDAGELAWIANSGPLVEPTSPAQLAAGSVGIPLGLYSHSDQIQQWQTSTPDDRADVGVGGRIADVLADLDPLAPVSMNISVSGTNSFQSGANSREFSINTNDGGAPTAAGYDPSDPDDAVGVLAIDSMLGAARANILRQGYGNRFAEALASGIAFNDAIAGVPMPSTTFGNDFFSQNMALIARTIAARESLGVSRQTFFVTYGGWDHHDEVINNQANMLPPLAAGMASFRDAMVELGIHDCVTTFTISDFGRTLTSNGRGSDHGWGGNQMVMGGAVNGGSIYGTFPELAAGSSFDTGRGRFLPTTSTDEFYAELALWFGIQPAEVPLVVPNVDRFYAPVANGRPVGFMAV